MIVKRTDILQYGCSFLESDSSYRGPDETVRRDVFVDEECVAMLSESGSRGSGLCEHKGVEACCLFIECKSSHGSEKKAE